MQPRGAAGEVDEVRGGRPAARRSWVCGLAGVLALALLAAPSEGWAQGVKRGLLIGINDYESLPTLRGAINDVEAVEALLVGRYGFDPANVHKVTDRQATRAGILQAFEQLVAEAQPGDFVYIHYSGHGSQVQDQNGDEDDGRDETLCPQDARAAGVADITDDELDAIVARLGVRSLVITLDSCHSGTALRGESWIQPRFVEPDTRLDLYAVGTRAVVPLPISEQYLLFTGAAADQSALDGPFAAGRYRGLFSYAFTQTLAVSPPDASARQLMDGVAAELEKVRAKLGGRILPEPQLEGPQERLDQPMLVEPRAAEPRQVPRLAYVPVQPDGAKRARLEGGVPLGAVPGSLWAVYPPGEKRFVPGHAIGLVRIDGALSDDARGAVVSGTSRLPGDSRAVLASPPPAAEERTALRLRSVPAVLRQTLDFELPRALQGDAVLVGDDRPAAFVIDCAGESDEFECTIFDASGTRVVGRREAPRKEMAEAIADAASRAVVLDALLSLENPAAAMELELRAAGDRRDAETKIGQRGIRITASLQPHRLEFYRSGEERASRNSLQLEVRTSEDCFLTLIDVDSSGNVAQIFPNDLQRTAYHPKGWIRSDRSILVPDSYEAGNQAGFHLDFGPPAGEDTIRAFCATALRDAELLRERVRGLSAAGATRAVRAAAARGAFAKLRGDLSRGLVVQPGAAAVESDWATSTVTLQIGE